MKLSLCKGGTVWVNEQLLVNMGILWGDCRKLKILETMVCDAEVSSIPVHVRQKTVNMKKRALGYCDGSSAA